MLVVLEKLVPFHINMQNMYENAYGEQIWQMTTADGEPLEEGLKVILCVGEVLEQREQGITEEVVGLQTKVALGGVSKEELKNIIIAYEPVWAIGTGKTATPDQAEEVNHYIRTVIAKLYDDEAAEGITIQYGGSMNAKNAEELVGKVDVDGGLIGGASLKSADFATIVAAASK